jgi:hypothetical protein
MPVIPFHTDVAYLILSWCIANRHVTFVNNIATALGTLPPFLHGHLLSSMTISLSLIVTSVDYTHSTQNQY